MLLSAIAVKPDLIINAGTAGGFQQNGSDVGDVYLCTGAVFHDHRVPLLSYRDYGRGFYPTLRTSTIQRPSLQARDRDDRGFTRLFGRGRLRDCGTGNAAFRLLAWGSKPKK